MGEKGVEVWSGWVRRGRSCGWWGGRAIGFGVGVDMGGGISGGWWGWRAVGVGVGEGGQKTGLVGVKKTNGWAIWRPEFFFRKNNCLRLECHMSSNLCSFFFTEKSLFEFFLYIYIPHVFI